MLTRKNAYFRYHTCLIIIVLILTYPLYGQAAAFHAVIAGDTADQNIGQGVTADVRNIWNFVEDVRRNTAWDARGTLKALVTQRVLGGQVLEETLSYDNLLNALHDIQSGSDDVIFFYYSGHGVGDDSRRRIWPDLFFTDRYFSYSMLLTTLKAKQPRLLIIVTDACNNFSDWTPDGQFQRKSRMKTAPPNQTNYNALFLEQQGYILATSSIPGEISSTLSTRPGSLFTTDLLSRLYQELHSPGTPTWERIRTTELRIVDQDEVYTQHPQYEIRIQKTSGGLHPQLPTPIPLQRPTPLPMQIPVSPVPTPGVPSQFGLWLNKPCGSLYWRQEPFQIYVRTEQDGYAIVYTIDAHNNVSLVFPNRHTPDNAVRASVDYVFSAQSSASHRRRIPGSPGLNEVKLLLSPDEFYHQSYHELQYELELLLDALARGQYRNHQEKSCEFYLR